MSQGTHSYFDWQVSTLMLAYDTVTPLARDDEKAHVEREQAVHKELYHLAHAVIPEDYKQNPNEDFPPEIVMLLTRATIGRAAQIMGMTEPAEGEDDLGRDALSPL